MPKYKDVNLVNFGTRLAELRKAAGYTQENIADEIGVSRRVIAYYEAESNYPPTTFLSRLAQALNMTVDALLRGETINKETKSGNTRLLRRLHQIERFGTKEKRQILQLLDTFIENERLKQRIQEKGHARVA